MKRILFWSGIISIVGASAIALAQTPRTGGPSPVPPRPTTPLKKQRFVHLDGSPTAVYTWEETPQGRLHIGAGGVILTSDDTRLTTDKILFNEKTQIGNAPGKLTLADTYNTLTGNTGVAYYRTRDAKVRGNVVIVARPKDEDKNAPEGTARRQFDSPVTITCEKLDYNWRTRIAVASEKLTVKQKDRTVTADRATYDGKRETVTLIGNVFYTRPNGEKGQGGKATIFYTKGKEHFKLEENIKGDFAIDDDGTDDTAPPAPDTSAPNTPAPSTPAPNAPTPNTPTPGTPN